MILSLLTNSTHTYDWRHGVFAQKKGFKTVKGVPECKLLWVRIEVGIYCDKCGIKILHQNLVNCNVEFRWRVMGQGYDSEKYDLCEGCLKGMIKSIPSRANRWKEKHVAKWLTLVTVAQGLILILGTTIRISMELFHGLSLFVRQGQRRLSILKDFPLTA